MARGRRGLAYRLLRGIVLAVLAWAALTIAAVVAMRWLDPPTSAFMLRDRATALVRRETGYVFRHEWRDWERISKYAAVAVIAAEDQTFPWHRGFDFVQIDKALADRERGRRARGASTISQQVAKNLFLWPGQSWFRKGLEAGITLLIESTWSKQRILEVYLNIAEFGPGVFGVEAASQRFFHKGSDRLTRREAALLAAVLPSPRRFRADAPSRYVRERQDWIVRQMVLLGDTSLLAEPVQPY
ncbi:MAG TPA: monofunctional biosynthetic peptidoglycan transglycosylase [Steroidobacteraceae bacterium]